MPECSICGSPLRAGEPLGWTMGRATHQTCERAKTQRSRDRKAADDAAQAARDDAAKRRRKEPVDSRGRTEKEAEELREMFRQARGDRIRRRRENDTPILPARRRRRH